MNRKTIARLKNMVREEKEYIQKKITFHRANLVEIEIHSPDDQKDYLKGIELNAIAHFNKCKALIVQDLLELEWLEERVS